MEADEKRLTGSLAEGVAAVRIPICEPACYLTDSIESKNARLVMGEAER